MHHGFRPTVGGWVAIAYATIVLGSLLAGALVHASSDTAEITGITLTFLGTLFLAVLAWVVINARSRH
jgi:hypothetical protein